MTKFKTDLFGGAKRGAQPPSEPSDPNAPPPGPFAQEPPKPEKAKGRKAIHPGLELTTRRCLKCSAFLHFRVYAVDEQDLVLLAPFIHVKIAYCECGIWTMDSRDRIRWIRYSSGEAVPGGGPLYAPEKQHEPKE